MLVSKKGPEFSQRAHVLFSASNSNTRASIVGHLLGIASGFQHQKSEYFSTKQKKARKRNVRVREDLNTGAPGG